jgi:hypothetical protein
MFSGVGGSSPDPVSSVAIALILLDLYLTSYELADKV